MIRAFAALTLPEDVREALFAVQGCLPVARPVPPENLHLTLVFLGEVAEPSLEDLDLAFSGLRAAPFEISLSGMGLFGGGKPRSVYAGVVQSAALARLQAGVAQAARGAGLRLGHRRFVPHVTLARPSSRQDDLPRLERAVAGLAGFSAGPFPVTGFSLFRSDLNRAGAAYTELAHYALCPSGFSQFDA